MSTPLPDREVPDTAPVEPAPVEPAPATLRLSDADAQALTRQLRNVDPLIRPRAMEGHLKTSWGWSSWPLVTDSRTIGYPSAEQTAPESVTVIQPGIPPDQQPQPPPAPSRYVYIPSAKVGVPYPYLVAGSLVFATFLLAANGIHLYAGIVGALLVALVSVGLFLVRPSVFGSSRQPLVGPRSGQTRTVTKDDDHWDAVLTAATGADELAADGRIDDRLAHTIVWEAATMPARATEIATEVGQAVNELASTQALEGEVAAAVRRVEGPESAPAELTVEAPEVAPASLASLEGVLETLRLDRDSLEGGREALRKLDQPD